MTLNLPSSLVGIGSHVKRVETLMCLESPQFRIVGLWGMGGISKTTIARAVFNHISSEFDVFHFVENVSNELRNQSVDDLWEKIVSKLFEEERLNMGNRTLRRDFIMEQLQVKKVLIVLDDVDDAIKTMKLLFGENDRLFCGGSRILVTSRDKQVLKNIVGDSNKIYEVKGLDEEDGLQLFSLSAFKQNHPTSDRVELSKSVLSYGRGNPLALVVLGHALFDESKEGWVSALSELGEEPFPDIQKVLRVSYDALSDQEKMIFLDIASFLVGKTWDSVVAYYKGSVKRIKYKIRKLADKSLITISADKKLEMHDLLKEMGCYFESSKKIEERTRICDFQDIVRVFEKIKGSSMIEAISINLSQVESISEFDTRLFARLDDLKYLEFYRSTQESKVRFCWEGFRGFPKNLRHFRWDAPSVFCAGNIVELQMRDTEIRELWTRKQNIVDFNANNFQGATKLVEFHVSEGFKMLPSSVELLKGLENLSASRGKMLSIISTNLWKSKYLKELVLSHCVSLTKFPKIMRPMESLRVLNLSGITGLKRLPNDQSFNNLKSLEELHLDHTAITELPSSIQHLSCLKILNISWCQNLTTLPSSIHNLRNLIEINGVNRIFRPSTYIS